MLVRGAELLHFFSRLAELGDATAQLKQLSALTIRKRHRPALGNEICQALITGGKFRQLLCLPPHDFVAFALRASSVAIEQARDSDSGHNQRENQHELKPGGGHWVERGIMRSFS